jgi:hypothetical protein
MQDYDSAVPLDDMPEEARDYAAAIMAYQDHPVVRDHFHQISLCHLPMPGGGVLPFFVLEFRDGTNAVFVWSDGHGNWGVGDWQRLPSADATMQADIDYFQGRPAAPSFAKALQQLLESKPEGESSSPRDR